jgi:hypothetical protein
MSCSVGLGPDNANSKKTLLVLVAGVIEQCLLPDEGECIFLASLTPPEMPICSFLSELQGHLEFDDRILVVVLIYLQRLDEPPECSETDCEQSDAPDGD